ncbi:MAG: hypothetical protein VX777_10315 [Chlamydiota bacterium]|nr:hypothetical protein [Chlamydiota bacterium]
MVLTVAEFKDEAQENQNNQPPTEQTTFGRKFIQIKEFASRNLNTILKVANVASLVTIAATGVFLATKVHYGFIDIRVANLVHTQNHTNMHNKEGHHPTPVNFLPADETSELICPKHF